jgi:hypothetical protein
MSKGVYNNQGRKSGGYPRTKILISEKKVGGQSLPCEEQRHPDCDGYLTFFPKLKGYQCQCVCHKEFIAPGDIKYKIKRRKYASFQNSLNRRKK